MDTMREKVKESFYFRTAVRVYNDKKFPMRILILFWMRHGGAHHQWA